VKKDELTQEKSRQGEVPARDLSLLASALLHDAQRGMTRIQFLIQVSRRLLDFSGCDQIDIRLTHGQLRYWWSAYFDTELHYDFRATRDADSEPNGAEIVPDFDPVLEALCACVVKGTCDHTQPGFSDRGSFCCRDTSEPLALKFNSTAPPLPQPPTLRQPNQSLIIVRLEAEGTNVGLMLLRKWAPGFWNTADLTTYERVAEILGLAVADRRAQSALRERIKELTCLYGIAITVARTGRPIEETLKAVVELLPPAWQFPEIACATISLDDLVIRTDRFHDMTHRQTADIVVHGTARGRVEVGYYGDRPEFLEGPFLVEENNLLEAVARQVAIIVERREAERERARLKAQLLHADRLATIGQLSAGIAHELNEPLSNILGFAQLAAKCPGVPEQAARDIEKITAASLYAREVIRKLMLYARQTPPRTRRVDLNQTVEEGLTVFDLRCEAKKIHLQRRLAPGLPLITADSAQLNQVLVNLVVNAIHAMPEGGTLTVETQNTGDHVLLAVEDTGIGMTDEIARKVFLPFFTTKDVNEGTGLGLAVVHGIITAHGGTITVTSAPGKGARFEIRLPVKPPEDLEENNNGR